MSTPRQADWSRRSHGHTYEFHINGLAGRLTITTTPGGTSDVTLAVGKQGSTMAGLCEALAQMTSLALANQVPVDDIADRLTGLRFEPAGMTGDPEIPVAESIADYVGRRIAADLCPADTQPRSTAASAPKNLN